MVWRVWPEAGRRANFRTPAVENLLFFGKWLLLAYLIEALMLRCIPADMVAGGLGGDRPCPALLGAIVGAPAYRNGDAAVPMVAGLLDQGMSPGAMSFGLAGRVSCLPAAVAVRALVKPQVFAACLGLAVTGAIVAGLVWGPSPGPTVGDQSIAEPAGKYLRSGTDPPHFCRYCGAY